MVINTKEQRLDPFHIPDRDQLIVIPVQDHMSVTFQEIKYLCLCLQDPVTGFQKFQMAKSDIRDHTGIRPRDLSQSVHLTEITDAHFQHRDLVIRAQPKYSQRNSQFIVEIPFCLQHIVFFFQHRGDHFFGTGLTDTAGNSHYRDGQLLQIKLRNILHSLQRRIHLYIRKAFFTQLPFCEGTQCPFFHHTVNKIMGIYPGTFNRNKQKTFLHLSAVLDNSLYFLFLLLRAAHIDTAADFCYIFQRKIFHGTPLIRYIFRNSSDR